MRRIDLNILFLSKYRSLDLSIAFGVGTSGRAGWDEKKSIFVLASLRSASISGLHPRSPATASTNCLQPYRTLHDYSSATLFNLWHDQPYRTLHQYSGPTLFNFWYDLPCNLIEHCMRNTVHFVTWPTNRMTIKYQSRK